MKLYCISDSESSLVFRLANIQTFEVSEREKAVNIFNQITGFPDAGIILITDTVASLINNEIVAFVKKNTKPLILEIPSYTSLLKSKRRENVTGK
ncbi:MAG: V-type ATP synthase subunit F [Candidatus Omnitrophica bacterium]|nr:V-type ATP synthase subunit F [Candidatus Omnitrophota bacterium]